MDTQQIKYFLGLAQELHFWNAANKMNITQSALSRHIQALENELKVQLFERNKRNVKLTPAGKFLQDKWTVEINKLTSFNRFAREIQLGESGTIRISHPDSISASILPEMISEISTAFPKIQIELVQLPNENQQEFLKNYKIDIVLTRDINKLEGIESKKIHTENLCLVVPENHPFQSLAQLSTDALQQQRFILPITDKESSYHYLIHEVFSTYRISPQRYLNVESGFTIITLVKKGLGITILPDSYQHHKVTGIRFIQLPIKTDLFINWRVDDDNPVLSNVLHLITG